MSSPDWENHVWSRVPWDELAALGAVAIAWPMGAIAANRPVRVPPPTSTVAADPPGHEPKHEPKEDPS